jgi:hypothetical protein
MTASTIAVRDFSSGSAVDVETSENSSSVHSPHHVYKMAISEDMVYGVASSTDAANHSLITAPTPSPDAYRNYVASVQVANSSGSAALVRIVDGNTPSPDVALAYIYVPAGTTITVQYSVPLKGSVGNAIYFSSTTGVSTIYVSAQGYIGE